MILIGGGARMYADKQKKQIYELQFNIPPTLENLPSAWELIRLGRFCRVASIGDL